MWLVFAGGMQEVPEWKAKLEARRVAKEAAGAGSFWRGKVEPGRGAAGLFTLGALALLAVVSCGPESAKAPSDPAPPVFENMDNRLAWDARWVGKPLTVSGELVRAGRSEGLALAVFRVRLGKNIIGLIGQDEAVKVLEQMRIGQRAEVSGVVRGVAADGLAVQVFIEQVVPK